MLSTFLKVPIIHNDYAMTTMILFYSLVANDYMSDMKYSGTFANDIERTKLINLFLKRLASFQALYFITFS